MEETYAEQLREERAYCIEKLYGKSFGALHSNNKRYLTILSTFISPKAHKSILKISKQLLNTSLTLIFELEVLCSWQCKQSKICPKLTWALTPSALLYNHRLTPSPSDSPFDSPLLTVTHPPS